MAKLAEYALESSPYYHRDFSKLPPSLPLVLFDTPISLNEKKLICVKFFRLVMQEIHYGANMMYTIYFYINFYS